MNRAHYRDEIVEAGILQKCNTTLTSGEVTDIKVEFDIVLGSPRLLDKTAQFMAEMIHTVMPSINALITVARGANDLGDPTAAYMAELEQPVEVVQTAKDRDILYFARDQYAKLPGLKAAILDDVFTKGTNSGHVGRVAEQAGAWIEGVAVVWRRGQSSSLVLPDHTKPVDVHALVTEEIPSYPPRDELTLAD